MRRSADFRATVRSGVRVGRRTIVVHATHCPEPDVLVGLVVSKSIGNAVTRNAVKRQLRHIARHCLADTPAGSRVVLRALPPAAGSATDLRRDVPEAWQRAVDRLRRRDGFA